MDTNGDGTDESFNAGQTATIAGIGELTIAADGAYTFTPVADYNGPVPVATYSMSDDGGTTTGDTSTLTISVHAGQ
ncbi:cadherin-like domain-containing protein [Halomonas sp.]|uniref:cadherin-like domain-containing protein n=1 Tax=Halomonas sp. TaxID=1486246 RepID=UPI003A0FC41A